MYVYHNIQLTHVDVERVIAAHEREHHREYSSSEEDDES
jgi:hypothetical protein